MRNVILGLTSAISLSVFASETINPPMTKFIAELSPDSKSVLITDIETETTLRVEVFERCGLDGVEDSSPSGILNGVNKVILFYGKELVIKVNYRDLSVECG